MFNFLFDGSIGEMLAPIQSPVQQLHLAIQHHRNSEVLNLISSGQIEIGNISNSGYADIHVACRYNNLYALEIIIAKGIPIDYNDKTNNTPLHYASKYGHLELCKYLVEHRASPTGHNSTGQTPYDVAESHVVRQYLLPLQFQHERSSSDNSINYDMQSAPVSSNTYFPPPSVPFPGLMLRSSSDTLPTTISNNVAVAYPPPNKSPPAMSANFNSYAMHSGGVSVSPPGIGIGMGMGSDLSPDQAPGLHAPPNTPYASSSSLSSMAMASTASSESSIYSPPAHAPPAYAPPPTATTGSISTGAPVSASSSSSVKQRVIVADGFGSSASDPVLQKKYGNVKETRLVAPPPTFASSTGPPTSYSMFSPSVPSGGSNAASLNRYVAYNPYAPPAAPSSYLPPASPWSPSPQQQQQQPQAVNAAPLVSCTLPANSLAHPSTSEPPPRPPFQSYAPPPSAHTSEDCSRNVAPPAVVTSPNVSVFNPATDNVISATSTSSSIL